jgi:hypothetical protein
MVSAIWGIEELRPPVEDDDRPGEGDPGAKSLKTGQKKNKLDKK